MELDLDYIKNAVSDDLENCLKKIGVYYRIASRTKSKSSIEKKMRAKRAEYKAQKDKMQDIIGVRLILYFYEDVDIVASIIRQKYDCISDAESNSINDLKNYTSLSEDVRKKIKIDDLSDKVFMPTRLNLVVRMNEDHTKMLQAEVHAALPEYEEYIDHTFEVQIRTILSEGWHEVEHDLRYKSRNEEWWKTCADESRMLNGIMATLETSERAMHNVFANIAYKNYKSGHWSAMVRNHLKLRTIDVTLSKEVEKVFNENKDIAKSFLKSNRNEILGALLRIIPKLPLTLDNVIFLYNRLNDKNQQIIQLEGKPVKLLLDPVFPIK